jgi:phospholipid/cholesterol/gamma-HCH transport system substrate-binding protein
MYYLKYQEESKRNLNKLVESMNNKDNVIGLLKDTAIAKSIKTIVDNLNNSSVEINKVVTNLNKTIVNVKDGKEP